MNTHVFTGNRLLGGNHNSDTIHHVDWLYVCMCVCVCTHARERLVPEFATSTIKAGITCRTSALVARALRATAVRNGVHRGTVAAVNAKKQGGQN